MHHIDTEKRLQLLKQIREDQENNRIKFMDREAILEGAKPEKHRQFSGFRFRLFLALFLFALVLYLQSTEAVIYGKTLSDYFSYVTLDQLSPLFQQGSL